MPPFNTNARRSRKRKSGLKLHWTADEDELLTALVQIHGPVKWDKIAAHIHGRTGKSCRVRWLNQLKPGVKKTPFTAEENRRLVMLHNEFGNKWSIIVSHFPGRTDNQVKNQYHILARTWCKKAADSSSEGLSQNQNSPMAAVDSQFSDVTSRGTKSRGFNPGSSSVYGKYESPSIGPSADKKARDGSSMISDANNGGMQDDDQFIDFLGVGFWGVGNSD